MQQQIECSELFQKRSKRPIQGIPAYLQKSRLYRPRFCCNELKEFHWPAEVSDGSSEPTMTLKAFPQMFEEYLRPVILQGSSGRESSRSERALALSLWEENHFTGETRLRITL
ncbi:hypothetical protein AVEN_43964-1 [Araneus ventricosus]|uniref:Uncharacterized protein n=1 Tax=Araneus ventricosus TaxID=182803 RepID=A0A4Y2KPB7_ARAVE|nr:hypothetical protein AVEN_43964-1 [Araneus ventricosus]